MQITSQGYKDSMSSPLREQGYEKVTFGILNPTAQNTAVLAKFGTPQYVYYSTNDIYDGKVANTEYATLEPNFTKADGSMFIPPRPNEAPYISTSVVTTNPVVSADNRPVFVTTSFTGNTERTYGLTIDFGDNYPTEFTIVDQNNNVHNYTNNSRLFVTHDVFEVTNMLAIGAVKMLNDNTRLRIRDIKFGVAVQYDNTSLIKTNVHCKQSLIAEHPSSIDASVSVINRGEFDYENPNSIVFFLETGQPISIQYGYEVPNKGIEWLPSYELYIRDWSCDSESATIRCTDRLQLLDGEYWRSPYGGTLYYTAIDILDDAGIKKYRISDNLKFAITTAPIPRVSHREALQMIANATNCIFHIERDGTVVIEEADTVIKGSITKDDILGKMKNSIQKSKTGTAVAWVHHSKGKRETEEVFSGKVYSDTGTVIIQFDSIHYAYAVTTGSESVSVYNSGAYFVELNVPVAQEVSIVITARIPAVSEQIYSEEGYGDTTAVWRNPLIDTKDKAQAVYYQLLGWTNITYSYSTRGNPAMDVGDFVKQCSMFTDTMHPVVIEDYNFIYTTAFGASVKTRRLF